MDYSRYVVNPWQKADWGQMERIGARRQAMGLANREQDLAERKMGLEERAFQASEKERKLSAKEKKQQIQEKRRNMLLKQLEFISNGLDAVDSQESLETFGRVIDQLESAGAIDPSITSQGRIGKYDEKKIGMIRNQLKALIGKLEKKEYGKPYIEPETGALLQEGPLGKTTKVADRPTYETITTIDKSGKTHVRSVKKGEALDLPEGEVTLEQYKADKAKSEGRANMSKEIDEIMATEQITRKEALKKWRADKSYPERIKLYNDTVQQIMDDPEIESEEQRIQQIDEARKEFLPEHVKEPEEPFDWDNVELPEGVTKEDVEFTAKKHNMSISEVLERLAKE